MLIDSLYICLTIPVCMVSGYSMVDVQVVVTIVALIVAETKQ